MNVAYNKKQDFGKTCEEDTLGTGIAPYNFRFSSVKIKNRSKFATSEFSIMRSRTTKPCLDGKPPPASHPP